jgi:hypothetical protein
VLFHQLGQHFVLLLQLAFQESDAPLARLDLPVGTRRRPEGRRPVLKKLLEPSVENHRVELLFVTQSRNRNLVDQVPAQNVHLLLGGMMLALVAHESSPL